MSELMLPDPPDDDASDDRREHGAHHGAHRDKPKIMSEEKCLETLSHLPGLAAMGLVKPQTANLIKGVCTTLLQHYQRKQAAREQPALASEDLAAVVREKPELGALLEPLLTDEQIDVLMRDAAEDEENGQA